MILKQVQDDKHKKLLILYIQICRYHSAEQMIKYHLREGRTGKLSGSSPKLSTLYIKYADGRTRTGTWLPTQDFESSTSTNFITSAYSFVNLQFCFCDEIGLNFEKSAFHSDLHHIGILTVINYIYPCDEIGLNLKKSTFHSDLHHIGIL